MKDIAATIRRLDEEIVGHHQQIARHRVEIMQLQDTRKVLMGLAEDDIAHAESSRAERANVIAGEHSRPQLIVRKVGTGDEEGSASKERKNGTVTMHAATEKQPTKRGPKNRNGGWKKGQPSVSGEFRAKILATLDDQTPMSSKEIGDYLGLSRDEEARKGMSNALYQLRVKGLLKHLPDKRYVKSSAAVQ
jgi:hypothetical protein